MIADNNILALTANDYISAWRFKIIFARHSESHDCNHMSGKIHIDSRIPEDDI